MPINDSVSVLIVDDDVPTVRQLARTLKGQDYIVHTATSAEGALQLLPLADILWLDLGLHSNGASSRVVLSEWMRAKDGPVCVYSTGIARDTEWEMMMYGADNVFPKPIRPDVVSTVMLRYARRVKRDQRLDTVEKNQQLLKRWLIVVGIAAFGSGLIGEAGFGLINIIATLF